LADTDVRLFVNDLDVRAWLNNEAAWLLQLLSRIRRKCAADRRDARKLRRKPAASNMSPVGAADAAFVDNQVIALAQRRALEQGSDVIDDRRV
jgi:hypothetical protein